MTYQPIKTPKGLRLAEVLRRVPVSKSTWWAGCKPGGRFPTPVYVSPRVPVWLEADIEALLNRGGANHDR